MNRILETNTKKLVDDLKSICANHGLGNDGNEYKIIIEVFLYKFMYDKFLYEIRLLRGYNDISEESLKALHQKNEDDYEMILLSLHASVARLKPEHFLSNLYNEQNREQFAKLFDDTMRSLASLNADIFSVGTAEGTKIELFKGISQYITDESKKDAFCRAIINKLFECDFNEAGSVFTEKFDFFATIFEYLIKDYNKDGGGKYAEYYTPYTVARIMSEILVEPEVSNVLCYDPSAGTGSLLMSLAHKIGENNCTIYSEDISQKSSTLLRLNLILNNLAHSLPNVVQGNTMTEPYHLNKENTKNGFDYIVSNPPFKLDFSEWRDSIDVTRQTLQEGETEETKRIGSRFFAGVPNIPNKDKDKMAIYLLFLQHIIFSLNRNGKAAVVVPTGFITAQSGIAYKIREKLITQKWLKGVVSMPSNIFATTNTNVSVLFIDKQNKGDVVLVDASKLGAKIKENKKQRTVLNKDDEDKIISVFKNKKQLDDFSVVISYDQIKAKNYSLSAGQYFDIKIEYTNITPKEFQQKIDESKANLKEYFEQSKNLEAKILENLGKLKLNK